MRALPTGTVTFLYTDLEGSTRLWEQQPQAMRAAVARHDTLLRAAIAAAHGHVFRSAGDGLCAAFATAPEAVAAALAGQQALLVERWGEAGPLLARMALHTGAVELADGDYFGACLNRVGRLLAAAHGGQVLLSGAVQELVRDALPPASSLSDLGEHRLRDLIQPERVFHLLHPALAAAFPPLRSLDAYAHNLPLALTSFVGRERELIAVGRLLATGRLVTLTGAGGCGKTRLALQAAAEVLDDYPDGVWLVELAALADPGLVPNAVAAALGVREQPGQPVLATLVAALRARRLLLVLDNCEHLLDAAAALVEALLRDCPAVRVLATSRELLGAAGEAAWRVPSLATPDPARLPPLDRLDRIEAVQLFAERARLVQPAFAVTDQNAPAVAQVCARLDGIPLALELAAARATALSVEQIAARLDDRFRLLTGGRRTAVRRQQTLQAAIDWSYALLTEPERALLRRLAVFAGGWALAAAEAVGGGDGLAPRDVLDVLTRLVEKSLAAAEAGPAGETRYRLLETVRQYAGEKLAATDEAAAVRDRHRDWCLALAEQAHVALVGPDQLAWFARLEREHDNLRAALEWSRADPAGAPAELRLAAGLARFWHVRGYAVEGVAWLNHALARADRTPTPARAIALSFAGRIEFTLGHRDRARALLTDAVAVARALGDGRLLANALRHLGDAAAIGGDGLAGRRLAEEAVAVARQAGDTRETGFGLIMLARGVYARGDPEAAGRLLAEAERPVRASGDRIVLLIYLEWAALLAGDRGDHPSARRLLGEAIPLARALGGPSAIGVLGRLATVVRAMGDRAAARAWAREALAAVRRSGEWALAVAPLLVDAGLRAADGELTPAARHFGATAAWGLDRTFQLGTLRRRQYEADLAAVRAGLGEAAFAVAWDAGQRLTLAEAIEEALAEEGAAPA